MLTDKQLADIEARHAAARGDQDVPALLAEVKRLREAAAESDRFRNLVERALNLRMHGERALTGPTWRQWDTNAETTLRDTITRGEGQC